MKLRENGQSQTRDAANRQWRDELCEPLRVWRCSAPFAADTAAATEEGSR